MATIDELLGKFPEMDPVLLRCIKLLQVGGKEGRKGIKDMTNELFTTRSASPLTTVQAKVSRLIFHFIPYLLAHYYRVTSERQLKQLDNRRKSPEWSWNQDSISNQECVKIGKKYRF